ncbi:phytoene/squalene synthase family protein [Ferrovibrio sp.]|uniref:phytoene/squalene synthase family protein n=1 Tax=Ferrovibrio sp. TaxID=1917215 RepID=UPI003D0E9147
MELDSATHCGDELRRHDPDRWLTALFAPDVARPALWALYAFNLEIARSAEQVSEAMLGHIRLQWWRETWDGIRAGTPRKHPVAEALFAAGAAAWDADDVAALIDARERDLEPAPPASLAELLDYAKATTAPLLRLACQVLGQTPDGVLRETLDYAGQAYALTGILRAVPFHAAQGRVLLPSQMLGGQGLAWESILRQELDQRAFTVMREIGLEARRLLVMARRRPVPRQVLPALLPLTIAALHLKQMERAGFDPKASADVSQPRKHGALLWAALRRRF